MTSSEANELADWLLKVFLFYTDNKSRGKIEKIAFHLRGLNL